MGGGVRWECFARNVFFYTDLLGQVPPCVDGSAALHMTVLWLKSTKCPT